MATEFSLGNEPLRGIEDQAGPSSLRGAVHDEYAAVDLYENRSLTANVICREETLMERLMRMSLRMLTCFGLVLTSVGMAGDKPVFDDASIEFFEKEVRPILAARCLECHASGEKPFKGGLRMDSRDAILKGGDTGPAVTLDKPAGSLLISAINYGDVYQMPPKSKLADHEIAVLTKWVEKGLPWPHETASAAGTVKPFDLASRAAEHWCWQPVKDKVPPTIAYSEWPITDVDRFILAKLESKGLKPAPPAQKHALLRRVYFDLIGLPPSPDEVESFVRDNDPHAFENVVDRLLGSVHFGERWARHWLDLVRYAETRGHEFEPIIPNAWQYRDYVIRALNADVPYDRFLAEHIAGDLLEPRWRAAIDSATPPVLPINESILGTGFWFLGEEVHSPVDIRKDETDRMDNRLDVLSKTFLGLTVGCARCHDHKFDAISQRDYYALAGFAISSSYRQIRVDTAEQHRQIARKLDELRTLARREMVKSIVDAVEPVVEKLDVYLLAAMKALEDDAVVASATAAQQPVDATTANVVDRCAKASGLDATVLVRWIAELNSAKEDKQHPLHGLFETLSNERVRGAGVTPEPPASILSHGQINRPPGLVVDFGDPDQFPPMQDGVSFGLGPVERGQLVVNGTPEEPKLSVATVGGWDRDLFWKKLALSPGTEVDNGAIGPWQPYGRKVRTPEFTMTTPRLWYLVRGSVRAYAAVNSHLIVVGPLHNSLLTEYKHEDDQWHWVQHGLDLYQGHRVHVEFSPFKDAPCSVAMVVQSETQPTLPDIRSQSVRQFAMELGTTVQRVAAFRKVVSDVVHSFVAVNANRSISETSSSPQASLDQSAATTPVALAKEASSVVHAELADWFVKHLPLFSVTEVALPNGRFVKAELELAEQVRWESSLAPAIFDGNGVDEQLLVRGNSNTPKENVPRRFLEACGRGENHSQTNQVPAFDFGQRIELVSANDSGMQPAKGEFGFGSGRLELAQQMLRSPLSSRVAVNRIWHHLFGRGIVPTVDNFGVLGLPPTHPELLDYLAMKFMHDGWSTKAMIRWLVLSQTYQMSVRPTDAESLDPDNQLWHRMPMKRLEGEVIRDSLLAVSGRLDRTPFGPSVPIHLTPFMQGRGRPGASGPLDGNGRRSIYISVRRNFLSPMMLAFDTPNPFSTVGRRTVSNVPAQALILMNDPFVIEQANRWADRVMSEVASTTEQRVDSMYLTAFARHPSPTEMAEAISFLSLQAVDRPESQTEAWRNLCHVLFNVKEFVFIE